MNFKLFCFFGPLTSLSIMYYIKNQVYYINIYLREVHIKENILTVTLQLLPSTPSVSLSHYSQLAPKNTKKL